MDSTLQLNADAMKDMQGTVGSTLQAMDEQHLISRAELEDTGFIEITPGVFETTGDPATVSPKQIKSLVRASQSTPRGRARLMLHGDRSDSLHEMVIVLPRTSCDHPHINFKSGKSFLALSGQFALVRFSDDGSQMEIDILAGDDRWRGARMLRLRKPVWHTIIPLEGDIVFLETIIGPFEGNRFAPWYPEYEGPSRAEWVERLRRIAAAAKLNYETNSCRADKVI
jgi:cupin fold WbuC family metalloprotein